MKETSYGIIPVRRKSGVWQVFMVKHRSGGHWAFPKGHPNNGESPRETAERELLEETGLTVNKFLSDIPLEEHYTFERNGEQVHKSVCYFIADAKGDIFLQSEELEGGKWVPLYEAEAHVTHKEARALCLRMTEIFQRLI